MPAQRKLIYPDPELNVPEQVRDGLDQVLANALNIRNRANKRAKFAFETSEDAVTWTVFTGMRPTAFASLGRGLEAMLLWGVPDAAPGRSIRDILKEILRNDIGEKLVSLTEPDVLLVFEDRLVVIEVKYSSGNSGTNDTRAFGPYLAAGRGLYAVSDDQVRQSRLYELARNWVVGNLLADRLSLPFHFINLGLEPNCGASARAFATLVTASNRRSFAFQTWKEFLAQLGPLPPWLNDYARSQRLLC